MMYEGAVYIATWRHSNCCDMGNNPQIALVQVGELLQYTHLDIYHVYE